MPHDQLSILDAIDSPEVDQNEPKQTEVWTTKEVEEKTGVSRKKLDRLNQQGKLPQTANGYTILKFAGKQDKAPYSNLWEVQET